MLCLWVNGQSNTAIRERSRILELQDRLLEWSIAAMMYLTTIDCWVAP
jgi:hypothetical protein